MYIAITLVAYVASILVWVRFRKYYMVGPQRNPEIINTNCKVSVIIPVRNEEENIRQLLTSLMKVRASIEIIVVDDQSTDHTVKIAREFPVLVISAGVKPAGWMGKSWACHVGAERATGDLLLFTDADTVHYPGGLQRACGFMICNGADMISAPAFHLNRNWWEKILGPFHCLMSAGASPYDETTKGNAYAMGQFLLIKSTHYHSIGGHSAIKHLLADDAALATRVMRSGGSYRMYNGPRLCSIQMYHSFSEFVTGWTRLMRLGMGVLSFDVISRSLIPLVALNVFSLSQLTWFHWTPALVTLACFSIVQRRIGKFSVAGIFIFPVSVLLFTAIGLNAMLAALLQLPVKWRGRSYQMENQSKLF